MAGSRNWYLHFVLWFLKQVLTGLVFLVSVVLRPAEVSGQDPAKVSSRSHRYGPQERQCQAQGEQISFFPTSRFLDCKVERICRLPNMFASNWCKKVWHRRMAKMDSKI